ncbi:MAG: class I SAM-dependent methyltransferase [Phycisphaerae bacterium]|nr:class I SAM-dependent methyltransferase [Phycisphaerae bacterium]
MEKYLQSCNTEFWKNVFKAELDYILRELNGFKDVLSVGCGPAIIEACLAEHSFNITGLDISKEALDQAPDKIRTLTGPAENMPFKDCSFDAVIYVASLQFIENYKESIKQTDRVLEPSGKLLVMLLNPQSRFLKEKVNNPASYVSRIKHTNLTEMEKTIAEYFSVQTEYFLGIRDKEILESENPDLASLYVIKGKKRH